VQEDVETNFSIHVPRLNGLIDAIASKGEGLVWNDELCCFEVTDGSMFQERLVSAFFSGPLCSQIPQDALLKCMFSTYTLMRGNNWMLTGAAFRSKVDNHRPSWFMARPLENRWQPLNRPQPQPQTQLLPVNPSHQAAVTADQVQVNLHSSSGSFQVSLQHFLDVTGAGDIFARSSAHHGQGAGYWDSDITSGSSSNTSTCTSSPSCDGFQHGEHPEYSVGMGPNSGAGYGVQGSAGLEGVPEVLGEAQVAGLVSSMWNESSLGDQAYFFPRRKGCAPFSNGSVVTLEDGVLGPDQCGSAPGRLFMVVSDNNAKWKGEPLPTPDEEKLGHWCAFLGQVPMRVACDVRFGDYLGPVGDGSGRARIARLGQESVVGLALSGASAGGVVKALVFAGFNALAPLGEGFKEIFERSLRLERVVEELAAGVDDARAGVEEVREALMAQDLRTAALEARIERAEVLTRAAPVRQHEVIPLVIDADPKRAMATSSGGCWGRWRRVRPYIWAVIAAGLILLAGVVLGHGLFRHRFKHHHDTASDVPATSSYGSSLAPLRPVAYVIAEPARMTKEERAAAKAAHHTGHKQRQEELSGSMQPMDLVDFSRP